MKKTGYIAILLCLLFFFGCTPEGHIKESQTNPIPGRQSPQDVITFCYPYGLFKEDYIAVFDQLNSLSKDYLGVTVELLTTDLYQDLYMMNYYNALYESIAAGMGPDLYLLMNRYHEVKMSSNTPVPTDLAHHVKNGYVQEITSYINARTPYLSTLYEINPSVKPLMGYDDKVYGIYMHDLFSSNPVFVIDKGLVGQLSTNVFTSVQDAINACVELNDKKLLVENDRIIFNNSDVMTHLLYSLGYYNIFPTIPYMYFCEIKDPECNVLRVDDTDFLKKAFEYKLLFEENRISAGLNAVQNSLKDNFNGLVAGVMSYGSFLSADSSVFDRDRYDVHILTEYDRSVYKGQSRQFMFAVSSNCEKPQQAVQYIDWLYSDPDANALIKYGIEDVHYKRDPQTKILYRDETTRSFSSLLESYTVDTDVLISDSLYINYQEKYYTEKITQNNACLPLSELIMKSVIEQEDHFLLKMDRLMKLDEFRYTLTEEVKLRSQINSFFDYNITYEKLMESIEFCRNNEYIWQIQKVIDSCR
ncbi:MAG TPA: hypothetical protein DDZ89_15070 [Clostridiales bacterium]|nr:hypothetical protein [Clostridiales bacterium]